MHFRLLWEVGEIRLRLLGGRVQPAVLEGGHLGAAGWRAERRQSLGHRIPAGVP